MTIEPEGDMSPLGPALAVADVGHLDLKSLRLLCDDLNAQGIVTKHRATKNGSQIGGRRLTYGPLAYLLKNRTYLGEMGHKGEWFAGEHDPIIDQATFEQVQDLIKTNSVARRQQFRLLKICN